MGGERDSDFQKLITGNFTAVSQSLDITSPNQSTEIVQISGTWSGTLVIEGSNNNTSFTDLYVINMANKLSTSTITSNGIFVVNTNAYQYVRIRSSSWTSGTATASVFGSDAASLIMADATIRGATDGTKIGNNGDKLKVDANLTSGQLVPTITNKLRFRYAISDVVLPNTGAYQTIYTRTGSGLFFGTQLGFDNSKVAIRVSIDGGVVFDLPLDDLKKFEFNDTTDGRMQMGGFLTSVGNFFDFSSRFAIPYSISLLIEAAVTDATSHKLKQYISIHTEDT